MKHGLKISLTLTAYLFLTACSYKVIAPDWQVRNKDVGPILYGTQSADYLVACRGTMIMNDHESCDDWLGKLSGERYSVSKDITKPLDIALAHTTQMQQWARYLPDSQSVKNISKQPFPWDIYIAALNPLVVIATPIESKQKDCSREPVCLRSDIFSEARVYYKASKAINVMQGSLLIVFDQKNQIQQIVEMQTDQSLVEVKLNAGKKLLVKNSDLHWQLQKQP